MTANRIHVFSLCALLFSGSAAAAHAQSVPNEGSSEFCALSGTDLLMALDGSWTIAQGRTVAGGVPFTPPPVSVLLEYDPERRAVDITSADLSDDMILFPVGEAQAGVAQEAIGGGPAGNAGPAASGCDWYALPILVGTNYYFGRSDYWFGPENSGPCDSNWEDCIANLADGGDEGELNMTLVLRFSSPQSGSGMVHYFVDIEDAGRPFRISATVELSR